MVSEGIVGVEQRLPMQEGGSVPPPSSPSISAVIATHWLGIGWAVAEPPGATRPPSPVRQASCQPVASVAGRAGRRRLELLWKRATPTISPAEIGTLT